jgi:DNA-binding PucR family transcriptional regulator
VARRLGVHPQTVRYRLRRLEELFGDALTETESRYELELALRGRTLLESRESAL